MSQRRASRRAHAGYARYLRGAAIGGVALLMVAIVAFGLGGRERSPDPPAAPIVSAADPSDPRLVAQGRDLYAQYCAACHGASGSAQPGLHILAPPSGAPPPTDELLFNITKYGGQRYSLDGSAVGMPAFEGTLTDAEIWAIVSYIKSGWPAR